MDSASLNHIIAQTRQNVEFLISQGTISRQDGQGILAKLPTVGAPDRAITALENLSLNSPPPVPLRSLSKAKAIWGYNEDRQNSNDLTFRAGDIIEVVEETNPDWWTGRYNGKQGLFPSNYVEKLQSPPSNAPYAPPRDSYNPSMPPYPSQPVYQAPPGPYPGPGYQPPGGGYQPPYQGPPQAPYNSYGGPPPPMVVQQAPPAAPPPQEPPKKSKISGLGNTLAHSTAGGVGFGAGALVFLLIFRIVVDFDQVLLWEVGLSIVYSRVDCMYI
ncbi:hypothetical protein FB45DRAFT_1050553 [Roridomyces roridus]|uniref:SH3 domain-containing protein n=1 Tax=Roridomyces roridus TaxID=1738132 RepID=A0AAD7CK13_9AGAR|nr:hypothetical protein FB45DRAFT_1050553 [Roridomyces roridus]